MDTRRLTKEKEIASSKIDDLEAMPPGSQSVLRQESLVRERTAPIQSFVHHAIAQGLEVLSDV